MTNGSKYKAKPTTIGNIKFASKAEAQRYVVLTHLATVGKIHELTLQPKFSLMGTFRHNGKVIHEIQYVADFRYLENGKWIVEDVKGMATPVYKLKLKLFLSFYGNTYTFREIHNGKAVEL